MPKHLVVFLSQPKDSRKLGINTELQQITQIVETHFQLDSHLATKFTDISPLLNKCKPSIVHFAGHGKNQEGLKFEDDKGASAVITGEKLAKLLAVYSADIECVFLNACHSFTAAEAIIPHVPWVIGMTGEIADSTALLFAKTFYQALVAGNHYCTAFAEAKHAIANTQDADIPRLLERDEFGDLPDELMALFKARKIALCIGETSAHFPSQQQMWDELHKEAKPYFNKTNEKNVKTWSKQPDGHRRLAELLKKQAPHKYWDVLRKQYEVTAQSVAPAYFANLKHLPCQYVLTTNLDNLLKDQLPAHNLLTWQDGFDFPYVLRENQPTVLHLHGAVSRLGTVVYSLSDFKALNGDAGAQARELVADIFKTCTVIFIGYTAQDLIFDWLKKQVFAEHFMPDWRIVLEKPSQQALDEAYKLNLSVLQCASARNWFNGLARKLELVVGEVVYDDVELADEYVLVNNAFLADFTTSGDASVQAYYSGQHPSWDMIKNGWAVSRPVTKKVLDYLQQAKGLNAVLISAAGGEGKTTALMQVAMGLAQQAVPCYFFAEPPDNEGILFDLLKNKGKQSDVALLIDQADGLRTVSRLLNFARNRHAATYFVFAARTNEWRYSQAAHHNRDIKIFEIGQLTATEATGIAEKLLACHAVHNETVPTLKQRLLSGDNQFLLAAMLMATHGQSLQAILKDVLSRINQQAEGDILLKALAYVVALEARSDKQGRPYFCSMKHFQAMLGGISEHEAKKLCQKLTGEVSLSARGGYKIETRHPVIAQTVFAILFPDWLDELDIHATVVKAAAQICREQDKPRERIFLTIIPSFYRQRIDMVRALYKAITTVFEFNAHVWQAWALLEAKQHNIGDVEQPYCARWLFKQGVTHDPKHAPSWQAWALLEEKQHNIGDVEQPYCARWLFKQGVTHDPKNAPSWQAWALLEEKQHNIGDVEQPYCARWLFQQGVTHDPKNAPSWQAWALMEYHLGQRERAKQLVQQGLSHCPNEEGLLYAQRKIEHNQTPAQEIRALIQQGEHQQAKQLLQQVMLELPEQELLSLRELLTTAQS